MNQFPGTPFFDKSQPISFWRKNLPHWEQTGKIHFVTFRLADSMPRVVLNQYIQIKNEFLRMNPKPWTPDIFARYDEIVTDPMERYVDAGYGQSYLKYPEIRQFLIDSIDYFDEDRYLICAYVIMPNHVHLLMVPGVGYELDESISSIMRYSATKINKHVGRRGRLWQEEPFDTIIRSNAHYMNTLSYIKNNPRGMEKGTFCFGGLEFRS